MAHTRDDVFFDQPGEQIAGGSVPVAFRPPTIAKPTPTASGTATVTTPFVPTTPAPIHFTPIPGQPAFPIPGSTDMPTIPGFAGPTTTAFPLGFPLPGPGSPPGSSGFLGLPITPTLGGQACSFLPPGALRDACLVAATLLPGGQTPTFSPEGATPGGFITPPVVSGLQPPIVVNRRVHQCPSFANGVGILWMNAAGTVVCLPRGHNGKDLGLVRKNPKRAKAFISAAQIKQLKSVDKTKKKAKVFAKLAGLHTHTAHRSR